MSVGEVAELLRLDLEEGRNWLYEQGVSTMRDFNPELQAVADRNAAKLMREMGIQAKSS